MIDLDDSLRRAKEISRRCWTEDQAVKTAEFLCHAMELAIVFESGDEEWVHIQNTRSWMGMFSIRLPLALLRSPANATLARSGLDAVRVTVSDFVTENLRASPDVLLETVMPYGWPGDFDPGAFSANDLFVVTV